MRLGQVKATNFRQLARKLNEIPWELYIPSSILLDVTVRTQECRLHHTDAVAACFHESIHERMGAPMAVASPAEARSRETGIFVRGRQDFFRISIDSSGSLLYKRGLKRHGGRAPLRETLGAAILMLAGYDGRQRLIDPMCGSGTFAYEAAMISRRIPAGWFRSFAFMDWPCFRSQRWQDIRRKAEKEFVSNDRPGIWSADTDPEAVRAVANSLSDTTLAGSVQVLQKDFFDWEPSELTECLLGGADLEPREGLVVLNPPYGRRLGEGKQSQKLIAEILEKLAADFHGWRFAVLSPNQQLPGRIGLPHTKHPLFHGGLKLTLLVGRVPE